MTLAELMNAISTDTIKEPNGNLCQLLQQYFPRLIAEGAPAGAAKGMLAGIACTLHLISENGLPSDLREIMDGEKIS